jgi:hypothetical protein
MPASQQDIQMYVQNVIKQLEGDPSRLTKDERRLAGKYVVESRRLERIQQETSQLRDQIRQLEARVRSLELQAADSQGRANGFLDYMASLKFEDDAPMGAPPQGAPIPSPEVAPKVDAPPTPDQPEAAAEAAPETTDAPKPEKRPGPPRRPAPAPRPTV